MSDCIEITNEEYVRSKWECVEGDWQRLYEPPPFWINAYYANRACSILIGAGDTEAEAFAAARAATESREVEIRKVEDEANLIFLDICACEENGWTSDKPTYERILARTHALLEELKRGWK